MTTLRMVESMIRRDQLNGGVRGRAQRVARIGPRALLEPSEAREGSPQALYSSRTRGLDLSGQEFEARVPSDRILVSESGIGSHADIVRLTAAGARRPTRC
jgi:hypothetical protein